MFLPADLAIRVIGDGDELKEANNMVAYVNREEENGELRRQIKAQFLHPGLWIVSAVVIFVVGVALDAPPLAVAIAVFAIVFVVANRRFRRFWNDVKALYETDVESAVEASRFFLIATHRGRVVATIGVQDAPGMPQVARTCKLHGLVVHPATRRMGIASAVVKEAAKRARLCGFRRIAASFNKSQYGAVQLFSSLDGFHCVDDKDVYLRCFPLKFIRLHYEMILNVD